MLRHCCKISKTKKDSEFCGYILKLCLQVPNVHSLCTFSFSFSFSNPPPGIEVGEVEKVNGKIGCESGACGQLITLPSQSSLLVADEDKTYSVPTEALSSHTAQLAIDEMKTQ